MPEPIDSPAEMVDADLVVKLPVADKSKCITYGPDLSVHRRYHLTGPLYLDFMPQPLFHSIYDQHPPFLRQASGPLTGPSYIVVKLKLELALG